jgi:membrane protease YdiL (CAAX protease family)
MNLVDVRRVEARPSRIVAASTFLAASLVLFELEFFAFKGGGKWFQVATAVGLPLVFTTIALRMRKSRRLVEYWPAFFSYSVVSIALFFMWLIADWPARWLGLDPKGPQGTALGRVSDALVLTVSVVVLTRVFQVSLGSVFLERGRLMLGLAIGLVGFLGMATFGVLESRSPGVTTVRLIGWAPWLLIFVLSNGFFEELMFRGLFLKKFEPLVGPRLSNLITAVVFTIGHAGVTYTADILTFLAITLVFALVWGYIMQKTEALWGSALFHAGADVIIMISIFAGVKM